MNKKTGTGIIIAAIAIPIGIYTTLPLFTNTVVNEEVPDNVSGNSAAMQQFEEFMAMTEEQRMERGQLMYPEEKEAIMEAAAQTNGTTVDEPMTEQMTSAPAQSSLAGTFVGVNDGIHNAEGQAKVISLNGDGRILRLENFGSTNGPDLYVYLATDKSASDFVSLGRLKGNIGNQNYEILTGTDLEAYDSVLIWCQAFSVLFGSAELEQK